MNTLRKARDIISFINSKRNRFVHILSKIYPHRDEAWLSKQSLRFERAALLFAENFGNESPMALVRMPGRINLLEYMDMAGGPHISGAVDLDIIAACGPGSAGTLEVVHWQKDLFPAEKVSLARLLDALKLAEKPKWKATVFHRPHPGREGGRWTNYLIAPFLRLLWEQEWLLPEIGARIAIGPCTLPMKAGLSSSSVLTCISYKTMQLCGLTKPADCSRMARMLGEAEWYVGTKGGCNDHLTILCAKPASLMCNHHEVNPPRPKPLPFPSQIELAIVLTSVEADKGASKMVDFNLRKAEMMMADELLRASEPDLMKNLPGLGMLAQLPPGFAPEKMEAIIQSLPASIDAREFSGKPLGLQDEEAASWLYDLSGSLSIRKRALFFFHESRICEEMRKLLPDISTHFAVQKAKRLGELVHNVHWLMSDLMEASHPFYDRIVDVLMKHPTVLGAKINGAGFGGSILVLGMKGLTDSLKELFGEEKTNFLNRLKPRIFNVALTGAGEIINLTEE